MNEWIGYIVSDKEISDNSQAVVVEVQDKCASECFIRKLGSTVAEENPDYCSDSKVVELCFVDELDRRLPTWCFLDAKDLYDRIEMEKISTYQYPIDRVSRLRHGLLDGFKIRVSSVSDPINQFRGTYCVTIERMSGEVVFANDGHISSDKKNPQLLSNLEGIDEALDWLLEDNSDVGVYLELHSEECLDFLRGKRLARSELEKDMYNRIRGKVADLPKFNVGLTTRERMSELRVRAREIHTESRK